MSSAIWRTESSAIDALVPTLRGAHLIIGKSTVPVGTCAELAQRISVLSHAGADVDEPPGADRFARCDAPAIGQGDAPLAAEHARLTTRLLHAPNGLAQHGITHERR